ncbi:uncharacterized protein [Amphiura filiformis]|uniref:uncharacterized protein n=1 Tax=Amphiura filiformis TaxID=82378 RepID=UPI003B2195F8
MTDITQLFTYPLQFIIPVVESTSRAYRTMADLPLQRQLPRLPPPPGQLGMIMMLSTAVILLCLPFTNSLNKAYECTCGEDYHIGPKFMEPSECPYGGEELRLCNIGTRKKSYCVNDTSDYCQNCEPGETYRSDKHNNCTSCLPCTKCREDEMVVSACDIYEDAVCKCPVPTVPTYPEASCPICPTSDTATSSHTCPICPTVSCPTCPTNPANCSTAPRSDPSTDQCSSCILSLGVEVFLITVGILFFIILLAFISLYCYYKYDIRKRKANGPANDLKLKKLNRPKDAEYGRPNGKVNGNVKNVEKEGSEPSENVSLLGTPDNVSKTSQPETDAALVSLPPSSKKAQYPSPPSQKYSSPKEVQKALKDSSTSNSSETSYQRLQTNCQKHNLQFIGNIPGDGNCFFHSIADQLERVNLPHQTHEVLRKEVVQYLRENPVIQGPDGEINFLATQPDQDEYLESMAKDGEWADHIIIVAMANMLQHDILVITSSPQGTDTSQNELVWIVGTPNFEGKPIMLGNEWDTHYRSLAPITSESTRSSVEMTEEEEKNINLPNKSTDSIINTRAQLGMPTIHIENQYNVKGGQTIVTGDQKNIIGDTGQPQPTANAGTERPQGRSRIPSQCSTTSYPSLGPIEIKIDFDHGQSNAAEAIADSVIAIMNSSREGMVVLNNTTSSTKENLISAFDGRMKDLGLIQPIHYFLPSIGRNAKGQNIEVNSSTHILHFFKENSKIWDAKWGMAYTSYTGSVDQVTNTENLLQIVRNDKRYENIIPPIPIDNFFEEGKKMPYDEGTSVEYKEFSSKDLSKGTDPIKNAIRGHLKYVSAFANTVGGRIFFGITDDGEIKGFKYTHGYDSLKMYQEVEEQVKKLTWIRLVNVKGTKVLVPLKEKEIHSGALFQCKNFIVSNSKKGIEKNVFVITVPRFKNGVVFKAAPTCPYYDESTGKVRPATVQEWCKLASECLKR